MSSSLACHVVTSLVSSIFIVVLQVNRSHHTALLKAYLLHMDSDVIRVWREVPLNNQDVVSFVIKVS